MTRSQVQVLASPPEIIKQLGLGRAVFVVPPVVSETGGTCSVELDSILGEFVLEVTVGCLAFCRPFIDVV